MNTFYLTNRFKCQSGTLLLSLTVIFIGLFIYVTRDASCALIYFAGLGIFTIFRTVHKILNEHIVISEKGIEYYSPWIIVETKWESIEKIAYYWHGGLRVECLLVDNSKTLIKKWSFPDRYPPAPFGGPFSQKTIFPLSCFADKWRDAELGQQIKQYAPHLFVDK
jgi:hypothetical protein